MTVAVIGAGASGLMAAYAAASGSDAKVLLFDKNPMPGKKILRTGNGKCNFLNAYQDKSCFYSSDPDLCESIIASLPAEKLLGIIEETGIIPFRDHVDYYYPMSLAAQGVVDSFLNALSREKVRILGGKKVISVTKSEKGFVIGTEGKDYEADRVIIAMGGKAAPDSGSEGDGYEILSAFGHEITGLVPGLVPLISEKDPLSKAAGVRVSAAVSFEGITHDGELQITEYGISGIPVFQISRQVAYRLEEGAKPEVHIRFYPKLSDDEIRDVLKRLLSGNDNTSFSSRLSGFLPVKLCKALFESCGYSAKSTGKATDEMTDALCSLMTDYRVTIRGYKDYDRAQVTAGGALLSDIDTATMESRLCKGLYICGEILDVDGICGGYNLQWAFTTGYLAGRGAVS